MAVVQWEHQRTTVNAFYLVTAPWDEDDPITLGHGGALLNARLRLPLVRTRHPCGSDLLRHRRSWPTVGDEKSFDTVLNTRLYRPVLPIKYHNNITRPDRDDLAGLERRLNDNPGKPETEE